MAYNYIVTAQKTTAVFNCVCGNFTAPDDLNLILDKLSRFEVYLITPEGLRLFKEIALFGRISVMKSFRFENEKKDLLFILTMKNNVMIVEINRDRNGDVEVITKAHGLIIENTGRLSETGTICDINTKSRLIALRIYDGILNLLKLDFQNYNIMSFNIRLEENMIVDFVFLKSFEKPILCFIVQEDNTRHLKTYEITDDRELRPGPWVQESIESDSIILIPVEEPYGGVIIIGQESITHLIDQNNYIAIAPPELRNAYISCYAKIDVNRFLIGDMNGRLFILIMQSSSDEDIKMVASSSSTHLSPFTLKLVYLGEISIPSCVSYLDNNHIFVGSRFGDSQLIKLKTDCKDDGKYIELIDTYLSLAPIVDLLMVDLDKQGQDQLITCSGFGKEGSLRIIRNGIGINELATIELSGIKGIWRLRLNSVLDNVIAIAFVCQTKLLKMENEDVEEISIDSFDCSQQTLFCSNIEINGQTLILQATASSIRLISLSNGLVNSWIPPNNILLISVNDLQIICSSRSSLYYLEIIDLEIKLINELKTEFETSCLDISSLEDKKRSKFCAIGLWKDISVHILKLPELRILHTEKLGIDIIPRSILMTKFDTTAYLFTAIGDGSLLYHNLNVETGALTERKKVILGTHPTFLKAFKTNTSINIFACSDRPTVIYSSNGKLIFSNVNLKEVIHMCPLNSAAYPDSLILADNNQLLIGQIDQIQKLHIRSVYLNETPRRITYQKSTQTFGVITMRHDILDSDGKPTNNRPSASLCAQSIFAKPVIVPYRKTNSTISSLSSPNEIELYSLLVIDQTTFEVLHAFQLMINENAISVLSCTLNGEEYYIVGTTYIHSDEIEPKDGRLIMLKLFNNRLSVVLEKDLNGVPYAMAEFNGKLLVAVNSSVRLFEFTGTALNQETSIYTSVLTIFIKTQGDFVLIGDVVRSFSLYTYNASSGSFTLIANDHKTSWLSSMEIINDETFIGSDNSFNIFVSQKQNNIVADPEHLDEIKQYGFFHLGDLINVMKHGDLVMNYPTEMKNPVINKPLLFGTYSGSIGNAFFRTIRLLFRF
ncbi:DNA damage-binding protein-like protein [Sarcoptes scabiei]|uniref:DNA damage-binding protein 1 n=1 Tax=Sarcoptes scabiei TaxID=52283 RepID=A0A131ZXI1_SARSC|nr:DNA damage-binding protein-like protein [Sarcoptes scabiei]